MKKVMLHANGERHKERDCGFPEGISCASANFLFLSCGIQTSNAINDKTAHTPSAPSQPNCAPRASGTLAPAAMEADKFIDTE